MCSLLLLQVSEGAFGFARERFLQSASQSLIERTARLACLPGLELGHSEIKKRICVQRSLSRALLQQLHSSGIFLFFVTQPSQELGQFRVVGQGLARFCRKVVGGRERRGVLSVQRGQAFLCKRKLWPAAQDVFVSFGRPFNLSLLGIHRGLGHESRDEFWIRL